MPNNNIAACWLHSIDSSRYCDVAVVEEDKKTTFADLFMMSKKIGSFLISATPEYNKPIAVYMDKSALAIGADLGIIYSGNAYCNLDVKQPIERTNRIISNIGPLFILTSYKYISKLKSACIADSNIIIVDDIIKCHASNDELIGVRMGSIVDTDPLCLINTSGSTGKPKSVVINHKSVIDFMINAIREFNFSGAERVGSLSPIFFDIYTFELYLMLFKGATIVIVPESLAMFPVKMVDFLQEKRISLLFWVPTVMVNMANCDAMSGQNLSFLNKIFFAGEVFPIKHLEYWMRHLPNAEFVNMYGPIEITVDCLFHRVTLKDLEKNEVPIGKPFRNTKVFLLNEANELCSSNEKGEICVTGSSLAMGYYNDPEKTSKAFVQNPLNKNYMEIIYRTGDLGYVREDGNIIFSGRVDFQIKHMGYRIELGEIESAILRCNDIENACVVYDKDKKKLILIYQSSSKVSGLDMRKFLGRILPKYMLPTEFYYMEELPRNSNGKIDRNKLKNMFVGKNDIR